MLTHEDKIKPWDIERLIARGKLPKALLAVNSYIQASSSNAASKELKHLILCLQDDAPRAKNLAQSQKTRRLQLAMACNELFAQVVLGQAGHSFSNWLGSVQRECRRDADLSARLLSVEGRWLFTQAAYKEAAQKHAEADYRLSFHSFWMATNAQSWLKAMAYAGWSKDKKKKAWQSVTAHARLGFISDGQLAQAALLYYGGRMGRMLVGK